MKKSVLFLLASVAVLAGCSRGQKFTVQGTLDDVDFPAHADSVKLEYELMPAPIQGPVTSKSFMLAGSVKKPIIARLSTIGTLRRNTRTLILEKGNITFQNGYAVGTPLNDSTYAFSHRVAEIAKANAADKGAQKAAVEKEFSDFVSRHKNDPCAVYAILFANHRLEPKFIRDLIKSTSPEIQNDGEVHGLNSTLKRLPF